MTTDTLIYGWTKQGASYHIAPIDDKGKFTEEPLKIAVAKVNNALEFGADAQKLSDVMKIPIDIASAIVVNAQTTQTATSEGKREKDKQIILDIKTSADTVARYLNTTMLTNWYEQPEQVKTDFLVEFGIAMQVLGYHSSLLDGAYIPYSVPKHPFDHNGLIQRDKDINPLNMIVRHESGWKDGSTLAREQDSVRCEMIQGLVKPINLFCSTPAIEKELQTSNYGVKQIPTNSKAGYKILINPETIPLPESPPPPKTKGKRK